MTNHDEWTVEAGYEPVRELFVRENGSLGIGGGGYCAYVGGRKVVDMWAGQAHPGVPWAADTTAVIMSATKGFAVMCAQILVDRGELDLDAPVARYWPEFAAAGKDRVLVRHVLLHTAGVLGYDGQTEVTRLDGTGFDDYEGIARGLAGAAPSWPPGTRHGYHALSVGWLLGEIVRRITGRSIGRFFHDEVAGPLGLETWIGTPPEEQGRVATLRSIRCEHLPKFLRRAHETLTEATCDPNQLIGRAFLGDGKRSLYTEAEIAANSKDFIGAEFPAGGGTSTARGLARAWAMMANDGELDGVRVLSPGIVEAWSRIVQNDTDALMVEMAVPRLASALTKAKTPRTIGYIGNVAAAGALTARFGPSPDAFGAEGLGGQYGYCDRPSRIAVGYVRSELALIDVLQPRLTERVYECARRLGHTVHNPPARPRWKAVALDAVGTQIRKRIAVPSAL